jgi:hypothetical protein
MKANKQVIILALITFVLILVIFSWINYLVLNDYIKWGFIREYFTSGTNSTNSTNFNNDASFNSGTSHTVDLPLTTTQSCSNFCGPTARCSITGQQCLADIDCSGCQPNTPPLPSSKFNVPGDNDSGKLTLGVTPQYSILTTDIGTQAKIITKNKFSKPTQANFGVDTWSASFSESEKLFNARYKPTNLQNMPNYPRRYSATGNYYEDGPLPSNAYLS